MSSLRMFGIGIVVALSSATLGCSAEVDEYQDDDSVTEDETSEAQTGSNVPYCQSQTISMSHIAKNHIFGEGNLTGFTRAPGVGDKKLAEMAKTNVAGWHGAWNNRSDAEAAVREVMASGCGKLTAWARDARVGDSLPITAKTTKKALTCSPLRECYVTSSVRIHWKKIDEQTVKTPGGTTKHVFLTVATAYPYINK